MLRGDLRLCAARSSAPWPGTSGGAPGAGAADSGTPHRRHSPTEKLRRPAATVVRRRPTEAEPIWGLDRSSSVTPDGAALVVAARGERRLHRIPLRTGTPR